jgi:aminoglycoside phosphotransferase (APT) family kinase protein
MAEWRRLGAGDVRGILRDFGVDGYRAHRPIPVGTINTNVRVETEGGAFFLRINEGKSLDDVAREAAIVAHVAGRGVPTPAPLTSVAGQPFLLWQAQIVSLFPWVPGRTLERDELTPAHATAVGAALAALHQAGADFPDHRPGRYEPDEIDRRLATIAALARPELMPAATILKAELAALATERAVALPSGLIHGDLFVDNVLFLPTGEALSALLDFEQASRAHPGADRRLCRVAPPGRRRTDRLRRRAPLRGLPLRRHPHHRRPPQAGRRGRPREEIPALPGPPGQRARSPRRRRRPPVALGGAVTFEPC